MYILDTFKMGFISDDMSTVAMDGSSRDGAAGTDYIKLEADGSRMVEKRCCMSASAPSRALVDTL